jgi:GNAT superfamily N-acetyltransferase
MTVLLDPPSLLNDARNLAAFNSGEIVLDEWLQRRALANLETGASRTYVICPVSTKNIIGFYSLNMGQILATDVAGSMRRNMPKHIPAVVLGRLAIDLAWQGKGAGRALLADVMLRSLRASEEVSARLVIVHAISVSAENFYKHHGFTRLPMDAPMLAIDLIKYKALAKLT